MTRLEHLLSKLAEECAEVGQRAAKAQQFGLQEVQPGQPLTNAERIMGEFVDLVGIVTMLQDDGHLPIIDMTIGIAAKKKKVEHYFGYADKCGTFTGDPVK